MAKLGKDILADGTSRTVSRDAAGRVRVCSVAGMGRGASGLGGGDRYGGSYLEKMC